MSYFSEMIRVIANVQDAKFINSPEPQADENLVDCPVCGKTWDAEDMDEDGICPDCQERDEDDWDPNRYPDEDE